MNKIKAGFVGFGEVNTPREFIDNRCAEAAALLRRNGLELTVAAPVSDDPAGREAARARAELAAGEWDVLILAVAGWIPSWAVFRTIEEFKHKPMVLWGLSGWRDGERWITTADQAGTTALRAPMAAMGYQFKYVVSRFEQAWPVEEVVSYARAASAAARLRHSLIGMAGYRDMRLYGTMYDGVALKSVIGPEIEHFELLEAVQRMDSVAETEVAALAAEVRRKWRFTKDPQPGTVEKSVRLYLAFRGMIEERGYAAFSFNDVDGVKKLLKFAPAGAMTLLHDRMDISTVPENDCHGAVTQLMVRYLTGQVGAYLEFYEFFEDGALMGVPDYVPAEIVDGPVTVMPNAFGSFGEGLLNVSKLKTGPVTVVRLGGGFTLHAATGVAEAPPAWEEAGWTPPAPQLPSLKIRFDGDTGDFIQNVMGQHYIICYGDHTRELNDLADILGIPLILN
jgi:L-fucose isomerase-like protein